MRKTLLKAVPNILFQPYVVSGIARLIEIPGTLALVPVPPSEAARGALCGCPSLLLLVSLHQGHQASLANPLLSTCSICGAGSASMHSLAAETLMLKEEYTSQEH